MRKKIIIGLAACFVFFTAGCSVVDYTTINEKGEYLVLKQAFLKNKVYKCKVSVKVCEPVTVNLH